MEEPKEKIFKIEPSFFNYSKSKTKKNRIPKTPKIPKIPFKLKEKKTQTIKKQHQLLKQIREFQEKQYKEKNKPHTTPPNNTIETNTTENIQPAKNSNFNDAFNFLKEFSNENKQIQPPQTPIQGPIQGHHQPTQLTNKTLKKYTSPFSLNALTEPRPIKPLNNNILTQSPPHISHIPQTNVLPRPPQYGCLKNGNLPTYRAWNNTRKNYTPLNTIPANTPKINITGTSHQLPQKLNFIGSSSPVISKNLKHTQISKVSNLHKQNTENKKIKTPKKQQKTLRRIHRVGKNGRKIAVLISNKTIRKNISTKEMLLKQTPIQEMKQYLLKKGFIKVGSSAPNEILRKMFITTQLMCGEIQNHNSENLLYNYLHNNNEN